MVLKLTGLPFLTFKGEQRLPIYIDAGLQIVSRPGPTNLRDPATQKSVDPRIVPYIVLPSRGFYQDLGLNLGDIVAVIYQNKVAYAVFGDRSGHPSLGGGSLALAQALGLARSAGQEVIYILFPGSGNGTPQTPSRLQAEGRRLFAGIGGKDP
jgi:hypothetical protein